MLTINTPWRFRDASLRKYFILAAGLLWLPTSGYSFGAPAHEAIAEAALQMLDPATKVKIDAILEGEKVSDASIWLDRVREHYKFQSMSAQEEAKLFTKHFHDHANWHFCNFIVGSTQYDVG